ncbi:aromatic ring-hydroxylating dioxygenase subunit alpha [Ponticoccus sp. SC2-23]|uniref:aromatic ring-hydroxylating oxygenase subunit alpha n=1 Tax=Alexandriicola marinus TaxID=2081710 RepID=UPI000FD8CD89|nr:aromatic ring-hydroxylating dioxygenase subunit alpha [Alexandriicola marinus]MBM1221292.1 aromatic ring-hydroxylating dioxygenase subunit alpha [Ponticoccus sp. SC6-9]MBM1225862.1 aromatic ring-hydroxylating dioxygenase subunit alpha [Ponticoccus sp. SC6-15]MBM1228014.1 aromatic ring-hydroxylating dioxygenase subunit alpha [Ponticoccus sp. SC6-38]MBM1234348.1 aromatic ring-hydroxylating dioxygenase subunit alpha [Ponticoccus sp. SC6-45]MBM1238516.1 aromatic ring-hydroxylating dioxygenase s
MSLEYAKNDWYAVADIFCLRDGPRRTRLLETDITVTGPAEDATVTDDQGNRYPVQLKFDHVWTTLGDSPRPLFDIPEGDEEGRRRVPCGVVRVNCSPLRAVENFLDIAHFPFVHTDILGSEPHTEVSPYKVAIREESDEVWATQVKFFQPQAAKSAGDGIVTDYDYRVPAPTVAVLYKTCPPKPEAQDVIAIFVQPVSETVSDVWPWMALYDDASTFSEMAQFQHEIFVQDRSILENQRPVKLPLDPKMEIPTRADMTSVAYRRWLKKRGAFYGALRDGA